jgi:hypothetical protein
MQRLDHMPSLDELADGLRAAIATEQYARAQEFSAGYARALIEKWRALPLGDPELARSWGEAVELVAWARRTALAQRAHLAARLEALGPVLSYLRSQSCDRHTLNMNG